MSTAVHVKNISSQTSEKEVRDFFSFCGKISTLALTPDDNSTQSALVTFEKETAAKTALLLDNTQLGTSQVKVESAAPNTTAGEKAPASPETTKDHDDVTQDDKPRSRVVAEYLAHGYHISDQAIERALAMDQQHGVSTKFTNALKSFDERFKATEKAQAVDAKFAVSARANAGWQGLSSYFEKALGTPTGQKLRTFYEQGNKQVLDVHNEARHLADLKKGGKNGTPEKVSGSDRTKCNCAADGGVCGCAPSECACASCPKNAETEKASTEATKA
ncbi:actin cytoskeleton protein [Pseudovirgaria hyperparasitica]|uniref:Actin cytoskeleton protein n=1 Tax=Pseudovirgaria hyperparasitica TaxID=470096 RepID=A0A6A6WEH6_9PEZI|nr:actin cytoskeleton protein [Pseudovirgaria hyperparasitica]KAF2761222.1 actin cytoskeleton protein [Pseudovirgaria hyperparasitica]